MQSSIAATHRATPTIAVFDNRGLKIRDIVYCRHPDTPEITESLITRHGYDSRGFLTQSADPRLENNFVYQNDLVGNPLLTQSADAGTRYSLNDVKGRPHWQSTPDGVIRSWIYEKTGRLLSIQEQVDGEAVITRERFEYAGFTPQAQAFNLAGKCVRHDDTAGSLATDSISLNGTPLSVTRTLPDGAAHTTRTTTDATGRVTSTIDAAGHIQRVEYDVAGLLKGSWLKQKDGQEQVIVKSLSWSAAGQKLHEEHGNGVVTTWEYEPGTQRLIGIKTERQAAHPAGRAILQDLRYEYDPVGNVLMVRNNAEETRFWRNQKVVPENIYRYDSLYQLVFASGREMANTGQYHHRLPLASSFDNATYVNYTRRYSYDNAGNLTQIRHAALNNNHTTSITVSDSSNRAVLSTLANKPSQVDTLFTTGGLQKMLLSGQGLSWTTRGELAKVGDSETYVYDSEQQRVVKNSDSQQVVYLPGLELRTTGNEKLQVICIGEAGRAQVRALHWTSGKPDEIAGDQIRYSYDALTGSSGLELDDDGRVISREEYYPFGGTAILTARSQTEVNYKTVRYSGKERDATGLYYYGYRYYQPWVGRWLSPDPAGRIDGLNLFCMVKNNPVTLSDVNGCMTYYDYFGVAELKGLDDILTFPENISDEYLKLNINNDKSSFTLTWLLDSPEMLSSEHERVLDGDSVSIPFEKDWKRSIYSFSYPGGSERINTGETSASSFTHEGLIHSFLGKDKAKHLTEVAHQGHHAPFAQHNISLWKGDNIIKQSSAHPDFNITLETDNQITLRSQSSFTVINTETEEEIKGLNIHWQRENIFEISSSEEGGNSLGYLKEKKRGMMFRINYEINTQSPAQPVKAGKLFQFSARAKSMFSRKQ